MTFTKEQLIQTANDEIAEWSIALEKSPDNPKYQQWLKLAEIALAALTAEPVAWKVEHKIFRIRFIAEAYAGETGAAIEPLYAAPPAPVSVPEAAPVAYIFKHPAGRLFWSLTDESNKGQSDVMPVYAVPPAPVVPDERYQHLSELYHAQEKRLFKIAQRIKGPSFDKYAYSSSQAIDVLEEAIFGESAEEGYRAAKLNQEKSNG